MKPVVILCHAEAASIKVAALTLLDRLVVAFHRAGCSSIKIVCDEDLPSLKRSQALGIRIQIVQKVPTISEPTLVARCNFLVQTCDVKQLLHRPGRLVNRRGEALPIGVVSALAGPLEDALQELEPVCAEGVAEPVPDRAAARKAERALWNSLTSASDGLVDKYFNRPVGRPLAKALIHTPATPNQVSIASMLVGLWAAFCFSQGGSAAAIWGAVLFQISAIFDCIDGDVARMVFKESRIGKWLDISADQVVHIAVFAAIAVGLTRQGTDAPALALGASAALGALLSFAVVVRGMFLPKENRSALLDKMMDAATTRDFSVLLLALAVFNRLEWFLWLSGIGVHLFWIAALALQWPRARQARLQGNRSA